MINKYHFIKGGSEKYLFELTGVLEKNGHRVIPFAMKDEKNESSPYSKYFVDNIEFNFQKKSENSLKIAGRVIYSKHSQKMLEKLIRKTKPDIAHLHMIDHQISPSILNSLHQYNIPMMQTVHQYKMICPNYRLYIDHKRAICEKCLGGHFYHSILEKCHHHSLTASALVCVESYIHRLLRLYDRVSLFHAPSHFMGMKLKEGGVKPERIRVQFLSMDMSKYNYHPDSGDYFLYFGRLSGEKGLFTLLESMRLLSKSRVNLWIVGDGPLRDELELYTRTFKLSNITFLGARFGKELRDIVEKARFVVVPSEWYENSPLVIYESFATGKPVIGANIGGIPEFVDEGVNGYLFDAGSAGQLAQHIPLLYFDRQKTRELGRHAREKAEQEFSWDNNYARMLALYQEIMNG